MRLGNTGKIISANSFPTIGSSHLMSSFSLQSCLWRGSWAPRGEMVKPSSSSLRQPPRRRRLGGACRHETYFTPVPKDEKRVKRHHSRIRDTAVKGGQWRTSYCLPQHILEQQCENCLTTIEWYGIIHLFAPVACSLCPSSFPRPSPLCRLSSTLWCWFSSPSGASSGLPRRPGRTRGRRAPSSAS